MAILLAVCGWLALTALIACPFLDWEPAEASGHPCCPRENPGPRCPISPSLQNCPFYATESKLGIVQKVRSGEFALPAGRFETIRAAVPEGDPHVTVSSAAGSELLHRIHVLRI